MQSIWQSSKNSNKKEKDCSKNDEETAFFSSTTNFFILLNIPELVQLHDSVKEIWEGINKSYVHPVKDQISNMEKTDTYM